MIRPTVSHERLVLGGDILAVTVSTLVTLVFVVGWSAATVGVVGVGVGWLVLLAARGLYSERTPVQSPAYRQVGAAAVVLIATMALVQPVLPHYLTYRAVIVLGVALPTLSVGVRFLADRRLRTLRRNGHAMRRLLAVGKGPDVSSLIDRLAAVTDHAYVVVGACVEGSGRLVEDVPRVGRLSLGRQRANLLHDTEAVHVVLGCLDRIEADAVCITPGSQFTGDRLRALAWALADRGVGLMNVPGPVEVGTRRLHVESVGGMAVLHMSPVAQGAGRAVKSVTDRVLAAIGVLVTLPLLVGLAVAVRLSGPGPVLFRQSRIGRDGRPFTMLKFRTMHADADRRLAELLDHNEHDGWMFKMKSDPRVTRIGRWLRRYSLDELPQLINVVRGEMSLVGPRPPLPDEVARYDFVEHRRLRVTPGMTGLWQVNGRSTLSWDETVRLDLRYVDNWSLGLDAQVLWKTGRAVVRGTGAY